MMQEFDMDCLSTPADAPVWPFSIEKEFTGRAIPQSGDHARFMRGKNAGCPQIIPHPNADGLSILCPLLHIFELSDKVSSQR